MPIDEPSGGKPGAKDLFNLVKKSPALIATGIAGVLLVGYILVKRNSSSGNGSTTTVPDATTLPATTTPGGYYNPQIPYVEPVIITNNPPVVPPTVPTPPVKLPPTPPVSVPTSPSVPSTPTTPSTSATIPSTNFQDDIVRTRYGNPTVQSYDSTHAQGVPIRSQAAATSTDTIRYAPYGSKIQVIGPAVSGTSNLGKDDKGTNFWYPVAGGGYISAFDVQSSFPAAKTTATVPSNNA